MENDRDGGRRDPCERVEDVKLVTKPLERERQTVEHKHMSGRIFTPHIREGSYWPALF